MNLQISNKIHKVLSAGMALGMVGAAAMPMSAFAMENPAPVLAAASVQGRDAQYAPTISFKVYDRSTGRVITLDETRTTEIDSSELVQTKSWFIPFLSELTDVDYGKVVEVYGDWYFPGGYTTEGVPVNWSTNSPNGTVWYWVEHWYEGTGAGSGSNSTGTDSINVGSRYNWTENIEYHSNYPNQGEDYVYNHKVSVSGFTSVVSGEYHVLSPEDCGFTSTPDGFKFVDWVVDEYYMSGSSQLNFHRDPDDLLMLVKDNPKLVLRAQWAPVDSEDMGDPLTLTFMDGEDEYAKSSYFANTNATMINCTAVHDGLTFTGWDTDAAANNVVYNPADTLLMTQDETVYAVWDEEPVADTVVLTYDANGGTGAPSPEDSGVAEGSEATFTVSSTEPTLEGKTFLGWADTPDAKEPTYQADDTVTSTTDKTLYAVWTSDEPDAGTEKVSEPGMDKKAEGQDSIGSVEPGDVVNFTLNSNIGEDMADAIQYDAQAETATGTYVLNFHDTLTGPITLNEESVKVTVNGTELQPGQFTLNSDPGDDHTFDLSFDAVPLLNSKVFGYADIGSAEVVVSYSATISDSAEDTDPVSNDAYVNDSATDTVSGDVVKEPEPPATGSQIAMMATVGGLVLIGGSAVAFIVMKKRESAE